METTGFYDNLPCIDYPEDCLSIVLASDYRQILNTRRLRRGIGLGTRLLANRWYNRRRWENEALANAWVENALNS